LKRTYTCNTCNVTLNSIEQYHAHLKGSKHQNKRSLHNHRKCILQFKPGDLTGTDKIALPFSPARYQISSESIRSYEIIYNC
ncbi:hypothetical protein L345_15503, partial [Ophiophagus hannah]